MTSNDEKETSMDGLTVSDRFQMAWADAAREPSPERLATLRAASYDDQLLPAARIAGARDALVDEGITGEACARILAELYAAMCRPPVPDMAGAARAQADAMLAMVREMREARGADPDEGEGS